MKKIRSALLLVAILVFLLVPSQAVCASSDENTDKFVYVLSSDTYSEVIGTFQSASLLTLSKSGSYFTSATASFFPVNTSSLGSGSLSYNPTVYSYLGDYYSGISGNPFSAEGNNISWSGNESMLGFGFYFSGDATFSYSGLQFSVISANDLSLLPTHNSNSFILSLQDYQGGKISLSGSLAKSKKGHVYDPNYDKVTWSYDKILQTGSFDSPVSAYFYLVGVDSNLEFGPFDFGTEYSLSEISSWQTERFYIKSVITSDLIAVAHVSSSSSSPSAALINSSTSLTCHTYDDFTLSSSIAPLSLTVEVSFPGNKEVADYLEEIVNGYDNTNQTSDNQRFEDSRQELQDQEDSLFSSALEGFGDLNMDDYSFGKFSAMAAAFTFVSGFMQSLYVKMGDFGVIVTIGLVVMIASKVIGLYRFSTGGDSS